MIQDSGPTHAGHYEVPAVPITFMEVAITGAAGQVGEVVRDAFDRDVRRLFVHREQDAVDAAVLDVDDRAAVETALAGVDAVVHLAWGPASPDDWSDGHPANVAGTDNVLSVAVANDVERVVLASSIHVAAMPANDRPARMESAGRDPGVVDSDAPARPDSRYGVAKAATEAMGRFYADRYGVEVIALRFGWLMTATALRAVAADAAADRVRFARANWLSPRDCRAVVDAAVRADIGKRSLTLPAISANGDRYVPITKTMRSLDYRPRDDAAAALADH